MRLIPSALLCAAASLAPAAGLAPAACADPAVVYLPAPPPHQGVGCYFYRGARYCSRYCYWEVDGFRYCQPRASEAVSQAPYPLLIESYPPGPPPPVRRALK